MEHEKMLPATAEMTTSRERTPDRSESTPTRRASSLTLDQALAAAPFAHGESARLAIRDRLLNAMAELLPASGSVADRARRIAADLASPAQPGTYGDLLAAVRGLSRGKNAISHWQIARVFRSR